MIPEYQTLMLPLLKLISNGQIHSIKDTINSLVKEFKLTETDLNEWLPSKSQKKFYNRVYWAKAHLKMAGTIENVSKGQFKITEKGKQILKETPSFINVKYLTEKFEDYRNLIRGFREKEPLKNSNQIIDDNLNQTPEEELEIGYQKLRIALQQELLSKLKTVHPSFFEKIVVELLVKMGYGGSIEEAGKATRYTNDEGIDGIIKEDKLGLDVIYYTGQTLGGNSFKT
jgi:restriction system protein